MSISIHIEGGSVSDIQTQMAALLAGVSDSAALQPDGPNERETPKAVAPKPKQAKPKTDKVEKPEPEAAAEKDEPDNEDAETAAQPEEKAETKPAEKLTIDTVRQLALDWVNSAEPGANNQTKRRDLFQAMLKHFDVEKFGDLRAGQLDDVVAYIEDQKSVA